MKIRLLVVCVLAALSTGLHAQTPAAPLRVACVGDSITLGSHSTDPYPAQLQKMLGAGYDVKNFGVGGRTLLKKGDFPYWKEKAYADAVAFKANFVVIMLGTNDTKPQNWKYEDEFVADYKDLLESFKKSDVTPMIFVCRPPPIFEKGNYGINEPNLDVLMPLISQVASEGDATVLDMHGVLQAFPETEADHIHPNSRGDGMMAQVIARAIKSSNPAAQ